jgi:hypothetical protein
MKVKDKLNQGVIFPFDILKDSPSFYETYKDKIMCFHFKYVTKLTENKFHENISDTFVNNVSISNLNDSFSILPKSKITLPDLSPEGLQKLRSCHYIVHSDWLQRKELQYKNHDQKAGRDITNNITAYNLKYIQHMVIKQNNRCYICNKPFISFINLPTFDRIDNSQPHTKENIVLTDRECNSARSSQSLKEIQTKVERKQYAKDHHLPLVLTNYNTIQQCGSVI